VILCGDAVKAIAGAVAVPGTGTGAAPLTPLARPALLLAATTAVTDLASSAGVVS
jgi:hypothetical protein